MDKFFADVRELGKEIARRDAEIFGLYAVLKDEAHPFRAELEMLWGRISLRTKACGGRGLSDEILVALLDRLVQLRENSIIQELEKMGASEGEIWEIREELLAWVMEFYTGRHEGIVRFVHERGLLSEFYRCVFEGVHRVGLGINRLFMQWQGEIFGVLYRGLREGRSDEEILALLQGSKDRDGESLADRSYSIVRWGSGGANGEDSRIDARSGELVQLSYGEAFGESIEEVASELGALIGRLEKLEDRIFSQKEAYIAYFSALREAFLQKDCAKLIECWRRVDACWIEIRAPLQVCHPFEYYEDRFRHCVAPEWDLRLCDRDRNGGVLSLVRAGFEYFAKRIEWGEREKEKILLDLSRIQSYSCVFGLFYGSELNGLFSAQVIPNDEIITRDFGKKIFAFPDRIIQMARSKPKMRLSYEVFGSALMEESLEILHHQEELWHEVYAVSTNGHEYGHMLWILEDTQSLMDKSGHFKNIEEFKATCGGLVAYFLQEDRRILNALMLDHIMRCVGLLGYREQDDVLPYYYEALMHLHGAFESGVLEFDREGASKLRVHKQNFGALEKWYLEVYENLARHYAQRHDALLWLEKFVDVREKNLRLDEGAEFVEWYCENYKKFGRELV